MKIQTRMEIRSLYAVCPNLKINYPSLESIDTYKKFLETNLRYNIDEICNIQDDGYIKVIQGFTFPFRRTDISFTIEFLNSNYRGKYTLWCPELRGCITQGTTKREAFDNLLYAISEVLTINYDILGHNPLTFAETPLPMDTDITFSDTIQEHTIRSNFVKSIIKNKYTNLYVGNKHIIFKKDDKNSPNITFLLEGINNLTKKCFENI